MRMVCIFDQRLAVAAVHINNVVGSATTLVLLIFLFNV